MAEKKTGTSGYLIIEDNGTVVTFKLRNESGPTFMSGKSWSGKVNGVNVGGTFSISGVQTITLGSWTVSSAQTVTLSIGATGTSGMGGPTSFSVGINRATVPPAPSNLAPSAVTTTSITQKFQSNGTGGSPIIEWNAQRSLNAAFTSGVVQVDSTGTTVWTGLTPGTTYYFRARGVNAKGQGPWSGAISATTLPASAPGISVTPSLSGTSATVVMTPPGGASGVTRYFLERRAFGTVAPVTASESATSPIVQNGLTPGASYEYRARARFGTYDSPWSNWIAVVQPNPNTDPGGFFDGSTPDTPSLDYAWLGAVGNSVSVANGMAPAGWRTFAQSAVTSGGTGIVFRASGGFSGLFAARASFFTDTTAYGFAFGTATDDTTSMVDVEAGATYLGSIYAQPSKSNRVRATLLWYTAALGFISSSPGVEQVIPTGQLTRLIVSAVAPATAQWAAIVVENVAGTGGSLWLGSDWLHLDAAMVSLAELYPYFDGSTPDDLDFRYDWVGRANASPSTRTALEGQDDDFDPLADPDCAPIPGAPRPPQINTDCIDEIGIWRRYWAIIPEAEVYDWVNVVPTVTITTGGFAARQVRVRFYANPDGVAPSDGVILPWQSEQVITYMPPDTAMTLDAVSESVWASIAGGERLPANQLVQGANGAPPTWPLLSCGDSYLISFDVPLDAPEGNISIAVALTTRTM